MGRLLGKLPCELLVSSPHPCFLSFSLCFSFSRSSRTASADFFLTKPAASKAVVARCIILTLPALVFRFLDVSLEELPGVEGKDFVKSAEDDGDNTGRDLAGRCGVVGVAKVGTVGVAGMNASSGAERVMAESTSRSFGRCLLSGTRDLSTRFLEEGCFDLLGLLSAVGLCPCSCSEVSAFLMSIHQSDPEESQASLRTEWTIWPVSNPRLLNEFKSRCSTAVENIIGAGESNKVAKFFWWAVGGSGVFITLSSWSERAEVTERRLVLTGVRAGYAGGSFDEELERETCWGAVLSFRVRVSACPSTTVSVCGALDLPLPSAVFLIVTSLAFRRITRAAWSEVEPSSSDPCSGVVVGEGRVGKYSDAAETLETSEAFDEVSWEGSAARSIDLAFVEMTGEGGLWAENQGWASV